MEEGERKQDRLDPSMNQDTPRQVRKLRKIPEIAIFSSLRWSYLFAHTTHFLIRVWIYLFDPTLKEIWDAWKKTPSIFWILTDKTWGKHITENTKTCGFLQKILDRASHGLVWVLMIPPSGFNDR